jgi:hypothetical protein
VTSAEAARRLRRVGFELDLHAVTAKALVLWRRGAEAVLLPYHPGRTLSRKDAEAVKRALAARRAPPR